MSNEEGKQLKITIAVDNAALEQFKRAIREVTAEVSKLVETLNRAGGMLGGVGRGVSTSARGGFNTNTGTTPGMQKPIGGSLTAPAEQIAAGLRGMARGSVDALRTMESASRSFMERSASNMRQFERSLDSLAGKYKNIQNISTGGVMSAGGGSFQTGGNPMPNQTGESFVPKGGRIVNRGGIDMVSGGGRLSRMWGALNTPIGGDGDVSGLISSAKGFAVRVGAPIAAVGAAYSYAQQAMVGRDKFLANEAMASQMDSLNRRSTINQTLGGLGMSVRRDMAQQRALSRLTPNDLRAALGPETFNALVTKAYQDSGNTGSLRESAEATKDKAGRWFNNMFKAGDTVRKIQAGKQSLTADDFSMDNQNTEKRAVLERLISMVPADQIGKLGEAIQKRGDTLSVREQSLVREFQGSALSRMGLMRTAGVGEKTITDDNGNKIRVDAAQLLGNGSAYTSEEVAGMRGSLGASAGRGLMGGFGGKFGAGGLLSMQYGGVGNVVGVGGVGAQYGNGAGLLDTLQGGIGRGGLDVTAGSSIAGLVSGAMQQGNNSMGGSGALEGLLSAASTGGAGGDMRMARMMGAGLQGRDAQLGGSTDQLQSAINVLAANKAAPGLSVYGKHALQGVGSAQMIEMLRKGEVSPELADMGINIGHLRAYAKEQSSYGFSRFIGGTGEGGAMETAALGARNAGGAKEYIGGLLSKSGLSAGSREGRSFVQGQARLLGEALHATGQASTNEQGMAMVMAELSEDQSLLPRLSGHGAHDPASRTLAADSKRGDDVAKKNDELTTGKLSPEIRALAKTRGAAGAVGDVLDAQGSAVNVNMKALNTALSEFTNAIATATQSIKHGTPYVQPKK